jgi:outer membrane lipoprotein-sorting protein
MNEPDPKQATDLLDQAFRALRNCRVPAGPSPELLASIVLATTTSSTSTNSDPTPERRKKIIRYLRLSSGAAAAAMLAVAAGLYWLGHEPADAAFQKALDSAQKAKSMRAAVKISIGEGKDFQSKLFKQGDLVRIEIEGPKGEFVSICDSKKKVGLLLDLKNKTAMKVDLEKWAAEKVVGQIDDFYKKLQDKKADEVQTLADEEIGGKKTKVYSVKGVTLGDKQSDWKIWIDPKIDMPMKMQMEPRDGPKMTSTYEYLGWNETLDPGLFNLEIPNGFKLVDGLPKT